jgi:hypothetical protein
MQFICDQNHKFHYPAKIIVPQKSQQWIIETDNLGSYKTLDVSLETQVCPFCHSKTFTEYVEPEADIVSVKSVPLEEVDGWLLQGYVVRELYAKTATLVLKSKPAEKDYVAEAQELAKQ